MVNRDNFNSHGGVKRFEYLFNILTYFKLLACWVILHAFLSSANFFQNQLFQKILSGIPSELQTVWIHIRPDNFFGANLGPI